MRKTNIEHIPELEKLMAEKAGAMSWHLLDPNDIHTGGPAIRTTQAGIDYVRAVGKRALRATPEEERTILDKAALKQAEEIRERKRQKNLVNKAKQNRTS